MKQPRGRLFKTEVRMPQMVQKLVQSIPVSRYFPTVPESGELMRYMIPLNGTLMSIDIVAEEVPEEGVSLVVEPVSREGMCYHIPIGKEVKHVTPQLDLPAGERFVFSVSGPSEQVKHLYLSFVLMPSA